MQKLQRETEEYILYSPDTLRYITDKMDIIFREKIREYEKLFGIEKFRKIQINYFDKKEDFREYIYSLRGERESLPLYAAGTFDRNMVNAYVLPNLIVNSNWYVKALFNANHETFHIMYNELVWKGDYSKRIVWYDEGMAQFLSG